ITVNDDHKEILSVESSRFERYLSKLYYDNNKKNNINKEYRSYQYSNGIINKETITNVIRKLQADAEFEGQTIPLHLRVAWGNKKDGDIHNDTKYYTEDRDSIYYDLTDEKWRCVKITKNQRWKILDSFSEERKNDNVLFTRYTQTPQSEPKRDYDHDIFDKFIQKANIKNKNHIILLKVVIVSLFVPKIPHPILLIHGDKGSAKSTLQKKIKLLVDPGLPELLSINFNKEEFIQQLDHNYLAFYDNVRFEPKWLSDEACKAVTEIGFTRRKLYTNNEDQIFKYIRCLSFSGINVIFTEPDALERSIMIELEEIKDEYKIPGDQIYGDFMSQIPHLLGYIFDTLSKAMHLKNSIKLEKIPRMADFAVWGEAIAQIMGYKPLEFLEAYYENLGEQNKEIIESDSFAESLAKMIDYETTCWAGSPKMLIQNINEYCEANVIDINKFPKQPNTLVKKLKKIRSIIRSGIGLEIIIERITSGKGNKGKFNSTLIKIRKISPESPESPINSNNEIWIDEYLTGDRQNDFNNISSQTVVSPVTFDERCDHGSEKEGKTGDSGDSGDILSNFLEEPDLYDFKGIDDNLKNKIIDHLKKRKYLKCHNKNCNKEYHSLGEYNSHCFSKHPKQPLYPSLELIKQISLEQRNNPWE
ncbi:MAG: hypothetical protein DA329_12895, partial [Candidatus Nitrosocosmicus sp.]|nr:hypothetical protein [Candidatus Nitrosocosmicus sp.]